MTKDKTVTISRELLERCTRTIMKPRDETVQRRALNELRAVLAQEAGPVVERQEEKLEKPAMVGCTRFSKGVSARLVIEAAQRNYDYQVTPEKEAERIALGSSFLESLQNIASPPAPVAVVTREQVEIVAESIYWQWAGREGFVPWVKGGNSMKQDEARSIAWSTLDKVKELNQ